MLFRSDRHDPMFDGIADVSMFKTGSSGQAVINTSADSIKDLMESYSYYIDKNMRELVKIKLNDTFHA